MSAVFYLGKMCISTDWKEKTRNKILESQQGNTIKTNDKFMKFSWLTVTGDSLNKEHQCVVKHESIRDEKVILFPSINKMLVDSNLQRGMTSGSETQRPTGSTTIASALTETGFDGSKQACLEDESEQNKLMEQLFLASLNLQFTNTSAYYTYFLLLLKSAVYLAIVVFCLLRRPGACADGKTS
ncbi:T-cell receptor gamma alternate reading frame protein [Rhynchocyon petersi]